MAEPSYGIIWNRLKAGKVVPFLGAGASFVNRPAESRWSQEQTDFLPSGAELAGLLADESMFPSSDQADRNDLAKVSSYYVDAAGREGLRDRLRSVFAPEHAPGPVHHWLAAVPSPMLMVVTNYDTMLERACRAAGKHYDLVVHPADQAEHANAVLWWPHGATAPRPLDPKLLDLHIDLGTTTVIYKMHGSVGARSGEQDNFVITEEDYLDFLSRMTSEQAFPAMFSNWCRVRSFLFLGYSLRDWNLRLILKNLKQAFARKAAAGDNRVPSWAIQHRPQEFECRMWAKRDVDIFDMDIARFVAEMRSRSEQRP